MDGSHKQSQGHERLEQLVAENNWDYANPDHLRAYVRQCALDLDRKEKASSSLTGLTDHGIDLTATEERDLRAYAERWDVSFEKIAEDLAATYIIIGDRTNTKTFNSLVKRYVLPRNLLPEFMTRRIYMEAMRKKGQAVNA